MGDSDETTETTETTDLGILDRAVARVDLNAPLLGGREVIVATGADRIRFLHGLVTGNVAGTPVGSGTRSLLLTTKGHIVSDLHVFVRTDDLWMVVPGGQAETAASSLSRYAIMDDFTAVPRPEMTLMALLGPGASAALAAAGVPPGDLAAAPVLSHAEVRGSDHTFWLVRVRALGRDGFWIGGSSDASAALDQRLTAAGIPTLAPVTAEVARIAALEPKWGNEITADYFPMEVGLSGAIDYAKGCYLGQEPIVRIRDRGHINWRLVGLDIEGATDPTPSDRLETDAKPKAGRITSTARLADGRGVALGLLHVSVPVGSGLRVQHGDVAIAATVRAEVL
ncbi:MAG TPA: hypothetical protein VFH73_14710 [Polyangia bacterium]|nr:hypothetical protein [Polyangia bacterium]